MYPLYLPLFLSAALTYQQARRDWIDPAILDEFPPPEVVAVLSASNEAARRHAEAQIQWRMDYTREWWQIHQELRYTGTVYDALGWARSYRRLGKTYESQCQEYLRELRHRLGPHLWKNRRLPKPIPDEWLPLFREMILPEAELLPPPMENVP